MKFWKKKKRSKVGHLDIGLDLKRCAECTKYNRPCLADGKPATFHTWAGDDKGLLRINAFTRPEEQMRLHQDFHDRGLIPNCCSMEALRTFFAIVEYPDGTVAKVAPEKIKFLDREEV
jgi:hypothetical protein